TVWKTAKGDAVFLPFEPQRIEHARLVGVFEIDCLPRGRERKAELILIERDESARWDDRAFWNDETIGSSVICQDTPGEIDGLIAVVVELDVIKKRIVRVGEDFVEDHRAQWARPISLRRSRRSAHDIADIPRFCETFTVRRTGQNQGMSGAVRGHWPGR